MTNSKYPPELRERATRLAVEARRDPDTRNGAIARIANQLDVHSQALHNWVQKAEADQVRVAPVDVADRLEWEKQFNHDVSNLRSRIEQIIGPLRN